MEPQVRAVHNEANSSDQKNSHCKYEKHSGLATFAVFMPFAESGCRLCCHFSLIQNIILPTEFAETVTLAQRRPNIG
jgi:hypothetical protein